VSEQTKACAAVVAMISKHQNRCGEQSETMLELPVQRMSAGVIASSAAAVQCSVWRLLIQSSRERGAVNPMVGGRHNEQF